MHGPQCTITRIIVVVVVVVVIPRRPGCPRRALILCTNIQMYYDMYYARATMYWYTGETQRGTIIVIIIMIIIIIVIMFAVSLL